MNTRVAALWMLGSFPLACVVTPGGDGTTDGPVDSADSADWGEGDGDGDGGTGTATAATSDGTTGGTTAATTAATTGMDDDDGTSGGTSGGSDGGTTSGGATSSGGESGTEGTTGGTPAACEATGWDESLAAFEGSVAAMGNTYWYTRLSGGSSFAQDNCSYETRVAVLDGAVVQRMFSIVGTEPGVAPGQCDAQPFVEGAGAIGDNANGYDLPGLTMEESYAGCCELLALEPADQYETGFVADADGLMNVCYANLANCVDGCGVDVDGFSSFVLDSFTWGTPPA